MYMYAAIRNTFTKRHTNLNKQHYETVQYKQNFYISQRY